MTAILARIAIRLNRMAGQQKRRNREACDVIVLDTCAALDAYLAEWRAAIVALDTPLGHAAYCFSERCDGVTL